MYWLRDWIWGALLIVLTVLVHCFVLLAVGNRILRVDHRSSDEVRVAFPIIMGATVLLVTGLLAAEAVAWGAIYVMLGALPDVRSAIVYSLEAMTTYGHADVIADTRWRLMGALEALNGMILFGLTTAFLFSVVHRAFELWPKKNK